MAAISKLLVKYQWNYAQISCPPTSGSMGVVVDVNQEMVCRGPLTGNRKGKILPNGFDDRV
jgi:hypothetical protein